MFSLTTLASASLILGFLCLLYVAVSALFAPLRAIPGPFLARFTRFWYLQEIYNGYFESTNVDLHRKYGKIVRIAPNEYSIDDPEAAKIIYGPGSQFRKADWYYGWAHPDPNKYTIFTDRNSKRHAEERRKYSASYSMSALVTYESFVDNCAKLLDQRFREFAAAGMSIDLGHWMHCYAFDVIGEITFSKRFGFLDAGHDIGGIMASLDNKGFYSTHIGVYPALHPYFFHIINYLRGSKATGDTYNVEFANARIAERKARQQEKKDNGPPDFLTKFLESHTADPQKFTAQNILLGCLANIVAGSDTTAITLNALLYHLIRTPNALSTLRAEISSMSATGEISNPVTFKEAQKMPYLQAVVREGLRMHPATGLPLARVVPEGGASIAGKFFPGGATVGINSWVAHRNTTIYGPDPDTFRPERWIASTAADAARVSAMDRYFLPFGLGSRTCLGKNISMLEISKLIPQLVRTFDFQLADGLKERVEEGGEWETRNRWFVKQVGFRARIGLVEGVEKGS